MRKLYLFVNNGNNQPGWLDCLSLTDDGHILGNHICSDMSYMMQDLHSRKDRLEKIKAHFGDEPYEIKLLSYEEAKTHEEFKEALIKAELRDQEYEKAGATIEFSG